nr:MAG TPA: hypothetical protein [Bacteriophage sp.]
MRISPKAFVFLCIKSTNLLVSIYAIFLLFNKVCRYAIFCSFFR